MASRDWHLAQRRWHSHGVNTCAGFTHDGSQDAIAPFAGGQVIPPKQLPQAHSLGVEDKFLQGGGQIRTGGVSGLREGEPPSNRDVKSSAPVD